LGGRVSSTVQPKNTIYMEVASLTSRWAPSYSFWVSWFRMIFFAIK
jgi:hypothetical protein